jgi:hypothetical protein
VKSKPMHVRRIGESKTLRSIIREISHTCCVV